jgi:serine O-acetyltransferase
VFFPDFDEGTGTGIEPDALAPHVVKALERFEGSFGKARHKYFDARDPYFDHTHTDQYAAFLYLLANTAYRAGADPRLCAKIYALNKALHALDVFYEVELPDIFVFQHPVGTVLGRARFSDYLFVYQRCSVGANLDNVYPVLGRGVVMYGGSAVIGSCTIGDNVWLSVGTIVMNEDVPNDSVVFGRSPHLTIRPTKRNVLRDLFQQVKSPLPEP